MATLKLPAVEHIEPLFGSFESVGRGFNIVLLGDGYTIGELADFAGHAAELAKAIVAEAPFDRMRSAVNIFRMDIVSVDSWASPTLAQWHQQHLDAIKPRMSDAQLDAIVHDMYCNMPSTNTALRARFCRNNDPRFALGDVDLADAVARSDPLLAPVHGIVVILNTTLFFGGGGGKVAWASRNLLIPTGIHELGHQGFKLGDEYHYDLKKTEHLPFIGAAPWAPNISITDHPRHAPWAQLLTPGVPLPTSIKPKPVPNEEQCPALKDDQIADGTYEVPNAHKGSVGAFEGA